MAHDEQFAFLLRAVPRMGEARPIERASPGRPPAVDDGEVDAVIQRVAEGAVARALARSARRGACVGSRRPNHHFTDCSWLRGSRVGTDGQDPDRVANVFKVLAGHSLEEDGSALRLR